jgi:LPS sulfotransferase NodH
VLLGVLETPLSKILVVSTERCGSTNFMKTLELTQNGKFWEHPIFNDFKSQIDNIGFKEFMDKSYQLSDFMGTKIVYKNNDMFIKEVIDYHDKVFLLVRNNLFEQVLSLHIANETNVYHKHTDQPVRKLNLYDLQKRVIANRKINDRLLNMVDKNSILTYENIKHILVGEKVNTQYTQIENINELNKHYKLNKEFYTYDY